MNQPTEPTFACGFTEKRRRVSNTSLRHRAKPGRTDQAPIAWNGPRLRLPGERAPARRQSSGSFGQWLAGIALAGLLLAALALPIARFVNFILGTS